MNDNLSINIFLDETDTPFARYYSPDDIHFISELEDFIISKISIDKRKIEIHFRGQNEANDKSLKTALLNTFSNRVKKDKYTCSRNNKKAYALYVIGIIIGLIYLQLSSSHAYFAGVLSIMCWVFIWSGTEVYFFENREIKMDIRRCKKILEASVY